MRTFVMGDIHGAYKALLQCLDRSCFDKKKDRLIQLGDITDGGDAVFECVEALLSIKNLIAIKGNHDHWFSLFLESGWHPVAWSLGGSATAVSYLRSSGKKQVLIRKGEGYKTSLNPGDLPESHRQFFARQHLYYIDETNNCYVHGGFDRHSPFAGQRPEIYYWDRTLLQQAITFHQQARSKDFYIKTKFNHIFLGHSNTLRWGAGQPMRAANIVNLDTGAGHQGRLTIMDIDTLEFWQSDPVLANPENLA